MNKNFWNFKAKNEDTGELMLYGEISSSTWFGDEVTPKQFKEDLDALGDIKNLNIYINSGGGDVFAGQAIYSMLKRHKANKTVYVDGLAASIASVIAMAGDKVIMPKNAMMMIHHVASGAWGSASYLREVADMIDKAEESIYPVYEDRTGLPHDDILAMIDAETWFTAEEAVKKGFADEIEKEKLLAASTDGGFLMLNNQKFDIGRYKNKPEIEEVGPITNENGGESQPVSDGISEQAKMFHALRTKIYTYEEDK